MPAALSRSPRAMVRPCLTRVTRESVRKGPSAIVKGPDPGLAPSFEMLSMAPCQWAGKVVHSGLVARSARSQRLLPAEAPGGGAPKAAAARREFNFNASRLNIGRPLSDRPRAPVRRVVAASFTGQRFQELCVKTPKWFHPGRELFRRRFIQIAPRQSYSLDSVFCPRANCCGN